MSEKDSTSTGEHTKPQEDSSPIPATGAEKPARRETAKEAGARVRKMMIENLKNRANHSSYREYPKDK